VGLRVGACVAVGAAVVHTKSPPDVENVPLQLLPLQVILPPPALLYEQESPKGVFVPRLNVRGDDIANFRSPAFWMVLIGEP